MTRLERDDGPGEHRSRSTPRTYPEGEVMLGEEPGSALTRQALLERALALVLGSSPAAALLAGCGGGPPDDRGRGDGMGGRMPDWMMSRGRMDPRMRQHMRVIHRLLIEHQGISRDVEEIPGVSARGTVSERPEIADLIRTHVRQMKDRVEAGRTIRQMDPVFREIFEHHTKIRMEIEETPGGVRVIEISKDPQVALLIRQYARRAVSVADGMQRGHAPDAAPVRLSAIGPQPSATAVPSAADPFALLYKTRAPNPASWRGEKRITLSPSSRGSSRPQPRLTGDSELRAVAAGAGTSA